MVNILRSHHVLLPAILDERLLALVDTGRIVAPADKADALIAAADEVVDHLAADLVQVDIDAVEPLILHHAVDEYDRRFLLPELLIQRGLWPADHQQAVGRRQRLVAVEVITGAQRHAQLSHCVSMP